jgi:hypothetical protein
MFGNDEVIFLKVLFLYSNWPNNLAAKSLQCRICPDTLFLAHRKPPDSCMGMTLSFCLTMIQSLIGDLIRRI